MKRLVSILLAIVVIAGCMSLVACGKANKDVETQAPTEKETIALEPNTEAAVSQTEAKLLVGKKFKDVAEYLADPTVKEQLDKTVSSLSSSNIDAEVYAEGSDTLVFKYTYRNSYTEEQLAKVKDAVSSSMGTLDSLMKMSKDELITYTDVKDPKVKVEFYTNDGKLILDQTW